MIVVIVRDKHSIRTELADGRFVELHIREGEAVNTEWVFKNRIEKDFHTGGFKQIAGVQNS